MNQMCGSQEAEESPAGIGIPASLHETRLPASFSEEARKLVLFHNPYLEAVQKVPWERGV